MDLLKTLAQRILPEIEKDIRRIVKDLVSEYADGMKELKALSKALLKGKSGKAAKVAGKRGGKRKMSKVAKARISKALKKAWAKRKGAKKVKRTTRKPAAPIVEANKGV